MAELNRVFRAEGDIIQINSQYGAGGIGLVGSVIHDIRADRADGSLTVEVRYSKDNRQFGEWLSESAFSEIDLTKTNPVFIQVRLVRTAAPLDTDATLLDQGVRVSYQSRRAVERPFNRSVLSDLIKQDDIAVYNWAINVFAKMFGGGGYANFIEREDREGVVNQDLVSFTIGVCNFFAYLVVFARETFKVRDHKNRYLEFLRQHDFYAENARNKKLTDIRADYAELLKLAFQRGTNRAFETVDIRDLLKVTNSPFYVFRPDIDCAGFVLGHSSPGALLTQYNKCYNLFKYGIQEADLTEGQRAQTQDLFSGSTSAGDHIFDNIPLFLEGTEASDDDFIDFTNTGYNRIDRNAAIYVDRLNVERIEGERASPFERSYSIFNYFSIPTTNTIRIPETTSTFIDLVDLPYEGIMSGTLSQSFTRPPSETRTLRNAGTREVSFKRGAAPAADRHKICITTVSEYNLGRAIFDPTGTRAPGDDATTQNVLHSDIEVDEEAVVDIYFRKDFGTDKDNHTLTFRVFNDAITGSSANDNTDISIDIDPDDSNPSGDFDVSSTAGTFAEGYRDFSISINVPNSMNGELGIESYRFDVTTSADSGTPITRKYRVNHAVFQANTGNNENNHVRDSGGTLRAATADEIHVHNAHITGDIDRLGTTYPLLEATSSNITVNFPNSNTTITGNEFMPNLKYCRSLLFQKDTPASTILTVSKILPNLLLCTGGGSAELTFTARNLTITPPSGTSRSSLFESLVEVDLDINFGGYLQQGGDLNATNIEGFGSLKRCFRDLNIRYISDAFNFAFSSLQIIGRVLLQGIKVDMRNIFPVLTHVPEGIDITNNRSMNIDGFYSLRQAGSIKITDNAMLESTPRFLKLRQIGPSTTRSNTPNASRIELEYTIRMEAAELCWIIPFRDAFGSTTAELPEGYTIEDRDDFRANSYVRTSADPTVNSFEIDARGSEAARGLVYVDGHFYVFVARGIIAYDHNGNRADSRDITHEDLTRVASANDEGIRQGLAYYKGTLYALRNTLPFLAFRQNANREWERDSSYDIANTTQSTSLASSDTHLYQARQSAIFKREFNVNTQVGDTEMIPFTPDWTIRGMAFGNGKLYGSNWENNTLHVWDGTTNTLLETVPNFPASGGMTFAEGRIYYLDHSQATTRVNNIAVSPPLVLSNLEGYFVFPTLNLPERSDFTIVDKHEKEIVVYGEEEVYADNISDLMPSYDISYGAGRPALSDWMWEFRSDQVDSPASGNINNVLFPAVESYLEFGDLLSFIDSRRRVTRSFSWVQAERSSSRIELSDLVPVAEGSTSIPFLRGEDVAVDSTDLSDYEFSNYSFGVRARSADDLIEIDPSLDYSLQIDLSLLNNTGRNITFAIGIDAYSQRSLAEADEVALDNYATSAELTNDNQVFSHEILSTVTNEVPINMTIPILRQNTASPYLTIYVDPTAFVNRRPRVGDIIFIFVTSPEGVFGSFSVTIENSDLRGNDADVANAILDKMILAFASVPSGSVVLTNRIRATNTSAASVQVVASDMSIFLNERNLSHSLLTSVFEAYISISQRRLSYLQFNPSYPSLTPAILKPNSRFIYPRISVSVVGETAAAITGNYRLNIDRLSFQLLHTREEAVYLGARNQVSLVTKKQINDEEEVQAQSIINRKFLPYNCFSQLILY